VKRGRTVMPAVTKVTLMTKRSLFQEDSTVERNNSRHYFLVWLQTA
jgi:hypothetical protein